MAISWSRAAPVCSAAQSSSALRATQSTLVSPAPTVKAVSSLGGGGTSTLDIVALALGAIALIVAVVGLVSRGGRTLA